MWLKRLKRCVGVKDKCMFYLNKFVSVKLKKWSVM